MTWIDFLVPGHTVGVHDTLEHAGEDVGTIEGGWFLFGCHFVQYRRYTTSAVFLWGRAGRGLVRDQGGVRVGI